MRTIRLVLISLCLLAVPFAIATPAQADGIRECEPGELNCQCGVYLDTSGGIKYWQVRTVYC